METVQAIFAQLGIDGSIFYQLVIIVAFFTLARFTFLSKLQFVIENRLNKTTKLDQHADQKLVHAQELSQKYQKMMDDASQEALHKLLAKKQEIIEKEQELYKDQEKKVLAEVQALKESFAKDVESKKKEIFVQADSLAGLLVNKISQ